MRWLLLLVSLWVGFQPIARATPYLVADKNPATEKVEAFVPPVGPEWSAVPGTGVTVHSTPRDEATALRLARHASDAMPRLAERLGVAVAGDVNVYVAPTEEDFRRLQPGTIPDWADGTAWPGQGLIYLRSPHARDGTASSLEQVLDHELVHILLGRAFAPRAVPQWLQEGVAQVVAGEYTARHLQALETGMLGGNLLTLPEITGQFPPDPVRATLAYAQSADLVAFISSQYGEDAMSELIHQMAMGVPFGRSLRTATGVGPTELDEAWRARLDRSPLWVKAAFSDTVFMTGGAALLLLGGWSVRRRNRAKLERWHREEALEEALRLAIQRKEPQPAAVSSTEQTPAKAVWVQPADGRWVH